jgi:hypothetical protein
MSEICRVDTDKLEDAAGELTKEKPALDNARTAAGTSPPASAFGDVDQSAPAARVHADLMTSVARQLERAAAELVTLTDYLRAWKTKYEKDTAYAVQCLVDVGKLRPVTPPKR